MTTKQQTDKSITTTTTKRTYNAPKGTKITGVEMLNDGKVLLTFAEDEGEVKEAPLFKIGDKARLKPHSMKEWESYNGVTYFSDMSMSNGSYIVVGEVRINHDTGKPRSVCGRNNISGKDFYYPIEWLEHYDVEFKRGDIVAYEHMDVLHIVKCYHNSDNIDTIATLNTGDIDYDAKGWGLREARLATPSEQQVLFDALAKEGKRWNAETLEIEDLDISEIVVDLLSACEYLNKPMPKNYVYEPNSDFEKQINAQITLQLIREAWNKFDGFVVDFKDNLQAKYYLEIMHYSNGAKVLTEDYSMRYANIDSSCYSFKSRERAIQFGNQFKELFKTAMGIE